MYNIVVNGSAEPETEAKLAHALNSVLKDEQFGVSSSYMSGSGFGTELHTDEVTAPEVKTPVRKTGRKTTGTTG